MNRLIALIAFSIPMFCQAQKGTSATTRNLFTLDAGFSGIQFGADLKVGRTQTVQLRSGLMPVLYDHIDYVSGVNKSKLAWSPVLSAEYRYYYNYARRIERYKETKNNGVNYTGFLLLYTLGPLGVDKIYTASTRIFMAGPMWGFNRALGDKFLFNLTLGPVYQKEIDNNQDGLKVYGDLRFCYIFN